ncbi:helicase UvrD [Porphyromonas sp. COT-052 OH4946]|uniref:AAA family ATPase n=1 Tax=Porphyromonas sp. COT-052 OH4946 TaxID=1515618 RepID=UPI00051E0E7E|nr:AAA family ATPase [Porphyromonas sp. COT-052 OH4946]KGL54644.1 helicase UvrD [Porphyromonas sp. COT-052 OH4946]
MDRRLILAVAGSGKTTHLINTLNLEQRFLIVTYTDNNLANIRQRIINTFGYVPQNITLMSYFQFLIRVCYRPFLKDKVRAKGITWDMPNQETLRLKRNSPLFYLTKGKYLYHNRIAKLCLESCAKLIRERIEKFYDYFMVDEIQDLGGHDFNLIQAITPTTIDCLFVGDFYQHTFDTSNDGNVNKGLYQDYEKYKKIWSAIGITIDERTLSNSYRCSPTTCQLVTQQLRIQISSHRKDNTKIILIDNQDDADALFVDSEKIKLFYREANKYSCYAENWGKSKGLDKFQDVCIVLNEATLKRYNNNTLHQLNPSTRNKLYVAYTRAKRNIYCIPHVFLDKYKQ